MYNETYKYYFSIVLLFYWHAVVNSQNLVQNPGFEEYSTCPPSMSAIQQYLPYATGWKDMAQSPDYFNVCNTAIVGVPQNNVGYQQAHSGVAYSGIFKDNFTPSLQGREYMRGSLLCPLIPGTEYEVTYYVSQAEDYENCSNNFGVYFLTDPNYKPPTLSYIGKYHVNSKIMICDTANWVEVKGTFVADSAYTYFIIGNPIDRDSTTFLLPPQGTISQLQTYYYIDDVSVISFSAVNDSISGSNTICNQGAQIYTGPLDTDIVSYEWIVPMGLTLSSGQGTSSSDIKADSSGTYEIQLVVMRYCIPDTLTKVVTVDTLLYSNFNDTSYCAGSFVQIDVTALGITFKWYDNSTASSILIDSVGNYWVEIFDGNCLTHYDFSVNEISFATPTLYGPDSLCINDQALYVVSGDSAGISYNWISSSELMFLNGQNSDSVNVLAINSSSATQIQVAYENTCGIDTLSKIIFIASFPSLDLGNDSTLCSGDSLLLDAGTANYMYSWSTLDSSSSIIVVEEGSYWLNVSEWKCISTDTINIIMNSMPTIKLGNDTSLCTGENIEIGLALNNVNYLWSTLETTSSIAVTESDIYWVEINSSCGTARDSITVFFEDCDSYIYIPNSFTPNGDGVNDLYSVYGIGITKINMQIYNRWGHLVFTSNSINNAWDGMYNGKQAPEEVYSYKLSYSLLENDFEKQKYSVGRVTLLR